MDLCVFILPGKAVRMETRTKAPANISADTSSVMSPEKERSPGTQRGEQNIYQDKQHPADLIWSTHHLKYLPSAQSVRQNRASRDVCVLNSDGGDVLLSWWQLHGDQNLLVGDGRWSGRGGRRRMRMCDSKVTSAAFLTVNCFSLRNYF